MAQLCGTCLSGDTYTLLDSYGCYSCGAQTKVDDTPQSVTAPVVEEAPADPAPEEEASV